eukprot:CAMPEP_0113853592 /NCGR_PEP_ID=MMETSP0372-20130328/6527_1 /TAXON_ID=340204 /ORGANISM="Lankesteria abbotti" /LENGTH=59 /DNA_ID=CAMNT_0000826021 /DNA_START=42 /DNA_END=218 /DNA_ORIENTATION=+ /assembly_acc=CAM_ASM_000359
MPKEVKEIRDFLQKANRPDTKLVTIVKRPNNEQSKFKIKTGGYLWTLVVNGERAKVLEK